MLPTASTPGYGYFYTIGDKSPNVACNCLREWIPKLQQLLRHKGILGPTEKLAVWQCTGGNPLSGGTHSQGGAVDIKLLDAPVWDSTRRYKVIGPRSAAALRVIREMCGGAGWPRYDVDGRADGDPWENNEHFHIALRGCVHNSPCRYQITEYDQGYDGMVGSGRDTFWRPSTIRTWKQGIAWANAQINGTATTTTIEEDDMFTDADRKALLYANAQNKAIGELIVERTDSIVARLNALAEQIAGMDEAIWNVPVKRGDSTRPVIQEVADILTLTREIERDVNDMKAAQ